MSKRRGTDKEKFIAWVLNKELGCKALKIADCLGWSYSTIRIWIKEVDYEQKIYNLEKELSEARRIANRTMELLED